MRNISVWTPAMLAASVMLASCGGGGSSGFFPMVAPPPAVQPPAEQPPTPPSPTYTVGGSVSGLVGAVVLQNNAGDELKLSADGTFSFPTALAEGGAYAVTVSTQPLWQFCTVAQGTGAARSNVTSVTVTCADALAQVSTLAGKADVSGSQDGTTANATFNAPNGIATDTVGNIYVADQGNYVIRKITPEGIVTTFAGTVGKVGADNGVGALASFHTPSGIATDAEGNVYVADQGNHLIRKITPTGSVSTLAGRPGVAGAEDGVATVATFYLPVGVAADANGNVYVADSANALIRKVSPAGGVTTLAGQQDGAGSVNRNQDVVTLGSPIGVALDDIGNVYVSDPSSHSILRITQMGDISTFAGSGTAGSTDGKGIAASFDAPAGIAFDASGNMYVADFSNSVIRKITPAGDVTTLAGVAKSTGPTDGVGANARFVNPIGMAVDAAGNVYVTDPGNHLIRKITPVAAP